MLYFSHKKGDERMFQMFRCPSCEKSFQINYSETITTYNKRGEECQIVFCPYCGKKFYVIGGKKK
jgi:transposase-like protein